ncbi:MAG: glutamyl-tRNA amidotransferase [Nitrospinae bacterium RIFCSPLOWO2_12_FULL_47_7]|nr:MAG: glutamyl-tRNA amidotransferase [Nitrospinae bacterium RIFCSPLOWO2_12_FULL_47_7]
MNLKQKLLEDIKGAMKSRDTLKLETLRLLSSEIKNKEIDHRRELTDDEVLSLLTTQIKKRKEAISMFEQGGRTDLKEKEQKELVILGLYLPEQVSEEALRRRVKEIIKGLEAQGPKDLGKVMKVVLPEFKGKADGSLIKNLVSELLGS